MDRNDGNGFVFMTIHTGPNSPDSTPLLPPGTSVVWRYKAIYRFHDEQVGERSDVLSVMVGLIDRSTLLASMPLSKPFVVSLSNHDRFDICASSQTPVWEPLPSKLLLAILMKQELQIIVRQVGTWKPASE